MRPRLRVVRRDDMGSLNFLKKAAVAGIQHKIIPAVISRILDQWSVRYSLRGIGTYAEIQYGPTAHVISAELLVSMRPTKPRILAPYALRAC